MANAVVPTASSPAADTSSVPTPVGPANGAGVTVPAPEASVGASAAATIEAPAASAISAAMPLGSPAPQSSGGEGAGTVNVSVPAAGDPPAGFGTSAFGLTAQPIAEWQTADFLGTGQSDIWWSASNAAWNVLGASNSSADYSLANNVPSADSFIGDSSMGDTLWYYASAGSADDWQLASDQSTTGTDFGDQSPGASGGLVSGNGSGGADWPTA